MSSDIWNYNIAQYLTIRDYVYMCCYVLRQGTDSNVIRHILFLHGKSNVKLPSMKDGVCSFPKCRHMRSFFVWDGDAKGHTNISPYCRLHTRKFTFGRKHILFRFPSIVYVLH